MHPLLICTDTVGVYGRLRGTLPRTRPSIRQLQHGQLQHGQVTLGRDMLPPRNRTAGLRQLQLLNRQAQPAAVS
jgi:hypothetical protein